MKTYYPTIFFRSFIIFSLFLFVNTAQAQMGKCKGKYLGNIIQYSVRSDYNTYWNQATSENGSKWGSVEGTQGSYNWSNSDLAFNWAKNNNGLFKYHNFVWGSQTPSWVSGASTATLTTAVENYIKACSAHYTPMGGLKMIDVVNEPVHTGLASNYKAALTAGYQRDNPGGTNQYGWIIWAFQLARKYHPNAKLLINEYNIETDPNGALVTYANMVNAVKNSPNLTDGQKNLIDGIGIQCHLTPGQISGSNLKAALDKLYSLTGVPIHLTEFDLTASPDETAQKNAFADLFAVAWSHPQVAGITLWGYVQGSTWRNGNGQTGAGGTDSGILYASGGERPALTWIKQYMASQPDLPGCPAPGTVGPGWGGTTTCATTAPAVTSPVTYCQGATSTALTATGTSLLWYTASTGGTGSSTALVPATATAGSTTYYVSQTANGCEGPRASIVVTVNAAPSAPQVKTPVTYCQNTTATALTATGASLKWYTAATGGAGSTTAPTPATTSAGTTSYYVSQTTNGCEGPRAAIAVTVNAPPAAPAVTGAVSYCQNASASALTATGTSLKWYTTATGGTGSATAPTPSTASTGSASYYVSQTTNGCESPRAVIAVTVNAAPNAVIIPAGSTTIKQGSSVVLNANTGAGLSYKWFNGTAETGTGATYTATTAGNYTVEVTNASGCKATSAAVTVTVNSNQPPAVSITAPANNATFIAAANINIAATATDPDGSVTKVEFYNGTALLGTSTASPYSFAWNNVAAGTYQLTAKATDNDGAVTTSAVVKVTVSANQPSVITINTPTNNSTISGSSVTIGVTATDPDGTIVKVEYLDNGTVAGTGTTAPYTHTIDTLAPGTHVITVRVTDSNGGVTTSGPVTVKVSGVTGILSSSGSGIFTGIYPNPSNGSFKIKPARSIKNVWIKNMYGIQVEEMTQIDAGQPVEIGGNLPEGTYLLIVQYASEDIETAKLVKIK